MENLNDYIRVKRSPQTTAIEVCSVTWKGAYTPVFKWKVARRLDVMASAREIYLAIENLTKDPEFFLKCTNCNEMHLVGHMEDDKTCHGCAPDKYGVVY